jgi:hypothetical protein
VKPGESFTTHVEPSLDRLQTCPTEHLLQRLRHLPAFRYPAGTPCVRTVKIPTIPTIRKSRQTGPLGNRGSADSGGKIGATRVTRPT